MSITRLDRAFASTVKLTMASSPCSSNPSREEAPSGAR
jgi:hypothetical protein